MKLRQRAIISFFLYFIATSVMIGNWLNNQHHQQVMITLSGLDEKIEFLYQLSEVK